jgi:hypothetical protein
MLYREIIAVCSHIHINIKTLCGQKVEFVNSKLVVHIVTTGPYILNGLTNRIEDASTTLCSAVHFRL